MRTVKFSGSEKYWIGEQIQNLTIFRNFDNYLILKILERRQFF